MVNVAKLRGKVIENGYTLADVAKALNVDSGTISRKLGQNGEGFTIHQADEIVKFLHLSADEATSIFFSQFVA